MRKKTKPGPEEDRLKIEGDWKDAVRVALDKKPPESGLPARSAARRARRKSKRK